MKITRELTEEEEAVAKGRRKKMRMKIRLSHPASKIVMHHSYSYQNGEVVEQKEMLAAAAFVVAAVAHCLF